MHDIITADLHNHSYYSDGVSSPAELVRLANVQKCELFALTDHDTTDGLVQAQTEADKIGIQFVPGVEISALWNNMTIHILGLGIDAESEILQAGLKQHQDLRQIRAKKIAHGLSGAGVVNALEKTQKIAKTHMITRTHFAQMLVQEGICKDIKTVFRRFLTGNKPGGVSGKWTEFDTVIRWIHAAGGKAVLAHPLRYHMTHTKVRRMMSELASDGCDGVEVVTSSSTDEEISLVNQWANMLGLLMSSGSDYHGWANQHAKIGRLSPLPNIQKAIWRHW